MDSTTKCNVNTSEDESFRLPLRFKSAEQMNESGLKGKTSGIGLPRVQTYAYLIKLTQSSSECGNAGFRDGFVASSDKVRAWIPSKEARCSTPGTTRVVRNLSPR